MKYNGVIQRKLALLDDQIQRLRKHTAGMEWETFRDDWVIRSMCERALQVATEIMIDIAERIVALENAGPVAGAAQAMEKLHELGVLASVDPYRSMVRFRNLIVHEYEGIKPELLYDFVQNRLGDFGHFREEIDRCE